MPALIDSLLNTESFSMIARVVLTSFFWIAGIMTLLKPAGVMNSVERAGLPMPRLVVSAMIVTELGGSALLIGDFYALGWLGAGWLAMFTVLSIPLGHPFWKFPPPRRMEEMQIALEHLTVIGGLMSAAALLAAQHQSPLARAGSAVAFEARCTKSYR